MNAWIGLLIDVVMIVVVSAGLVQVGRLIKQLQDLRAGRAEMDRFVRDFNGAVMRAESGIKALRSAARESGDDLEKLVDKAVAVRDELHFIVESADGIAERLSSSTATALGSERPAPVAKAAAKAASASAIKPDEDVYAMREPSLGKAAAGEGRDAPAASRAEQELLLALKKLNLGKS